MIPILRDEEVPNSLVKSFIQDKESHREPVQLDDDLEAAGGWAERFQGHPRP